MTPCFGLKTWIICNEVKLYDATGIMDLKSNLLKTKIAMFDKENGSEVRTSKGDRKTLYGHCIKQEKFAKTSMERYWYWCQLELVVSFSYHMSLISLSCVLIFLGLLCLLPFHNLFWKSDKYRCM